jgi:dihydrolipoamide dehydrogenase
MPDLTCDVAILGAGTAGRAAERSARGHGASTLLIDPTFSGTTCVRVGCMPSKLLIAAAEAAEAVRRAGTFGIRAAEPIIDGPAVLARVRELREHFAAAERKSLEDLPEGICIKGKARFLGPNRLDLGDGRQVEAKAFVIATGSSPKVPDSFDAVREFVLTNENLFELDDLPASLAVIGAGPLGLELAQAMARLGVEVTVFDEGNGIGGCEDKDIAETLRAILEKDMTLVMGVKLKATPAQGGAELSWSGGSEGRRVFSRLLVATGRPPNLAGLDLEAAGIALDDHGTPRFDEETMQCGASSIFMAGDADHDRPVLHEATDEGTIAGRNAARFPDVTPSPRSVPFSIMFTDPALAVIGKVPKPDDSEVLTGRASYADQGRARVMALNVGAAHLYADRATGRLLGATLATPGAEHMGHMLAWAVQNELGVTDLLDMPFYHPTLEEGLKPALRELCKAIGLTPPSRDEARASGA